jgi:RNA polymerase sigma-70 factor (ECF subfamily)
MLSAFRRLRAPPAVPPSDPERIRCIAEGDREALAALYRDYQPRLARFLSRHTRQEGLIEEVVNDTFWVVWKQAGQFRGDARVSTWIMGIAYRLALKAFRDQDDLTRHDSDELLATTLLCDPEGDRELRDWVGKGLRLLPEDQRMTVELVYGQGHTLEETAAIMDCPVGTAKARLFHARVRLRNLLPDLAGDTPLSHHDGSQHER